MRKGERIIVSSVSSLFDGYEGEIVKKDRYYIHVKLDSHPYVEKFTKDELKVIKEIEVY